MPQKMTAEYEIVDAWIITDRGEEIEMAVEVPIGIWNDEREAIDSFVEQYVRSEAGEGEVGWTE